MGQRWCKICDGWHDLEAQWPQECIQHYIPKRSKLSAPMIVSDQLDYVQSQSDGKYYTSKRALRRAYREQGMVEIGNEKQIKKVKHRNDARGVREALVKAEARVNRGERTEAFKRKNPLK